MKTWLNICFLALSIFALVLALPDAIARPDNVTNVEQYMRLGFSGTWSRQWTTATSTGTGGLVLETPGDSTYSASDDDQHLFEWGSRVIVCCNTNDAVFAWVMDTGVTVETSGLITDGGNTGPGPTFRVENGCVEDSPVQSAFALKPWETYRAGRRAGFCTGTTSRRHAGFPCDADADCGGGSGACRTTCVVGGTNYCRGNNNFGYTDPFYMTRGVFLQSISDTTAADCYVTELR